MIRSDCRYYFVLVYFFSVQIMIFFYLTYVDHLNKLCELLIPLCIIKRTTVSVSVIFCYICLKVSRVTIDIILCKCLCSILSGSVRYYMYFSVILSALSDVFWSLSAVCYYHSFVYLFSF